jgi:hypothetical protein
MRPSKLDHSLAALERAAERAHEEPFAKSHVDWRTRGHITRPLDRCEEAACDLERFLAHGAADARDTALHAWLYDAAKTVSAISIAIRDALVSVDAARDLGGTARGAVRRVAFEALVGLGGRDDAIVRREVDEAFLRALSVWDVALEDAVGAPQPFVDLLLQQRKTISRLHRELAGRWPCPEP